MTKPIAYAPEPGQKYQLLCRRHTRTWAHCDYAANPAEKQSLLQDYRLAFGPDWEFKTILLPRKYWPK